MDGIIALLLSKKFTKDTVIGMGAIKGAACQVQSINKVGKTTTVTLKWEDNTGSIHTQSFEIEDGANGISVSNATINVSGNLILTLSDGSTIDCGKVLPQYDTMPTPSSSNEGQILQYIGNTTSDYTNGYFYECINDSGVYKWVEKPVQDSFRYSTMPTASSDNLNNIVEYIGTTDSTYTNGYFYQCRFDGTNYSWVQKNVQPNNGGTGGDSVIDGYYNSTDHLFYEENTFINPITGEDNTLYVSLDTNLLYRYNGLIFIRVDESSSGENDVIDGYYNTTDHKFYEESTYTTEITGQTGKIYISDDTNIQYRWDGTQFVTISSSIVVDNSLSDTSENPVQNKVVYNALDNKVDKVAAKGLSENDYTDTDKAIVDNVATNLASKADKVISATNNDFATLDTNGNLTDSGISKDIVPSNAATNNKLVTANDISTLSNKANKVTTATNGDIATLDSNGDLTDSGFNKDIIPSTATNLNKLATIADIPDELNDLDDVVITSPVNKQILAYNSTSGKWENQTGQETIGGIVPKGSILFANLPTTGMSNGDAYDIKDAFVTDNRFEEGSGIECGAGTDIVWIADENKWNILTPSGVYSFNGRTGAVIPAKSDYNADQIDYDNTTSGLTATDVQDAIDELSSEKADKVTSATNGHLAGLDSNGNLTDSNVVANDVIQKVATATGLLKDDGAVDTTEYQPKTLATPIQTLSGSQSTVETALDGINDDVVKTFTGTQAQWDALSLADKQKYEICNITDDGSTDNVYTVSEVDALLNEKLNYVMYEEEIHGVNLIPNKAYTQTYSGLTFTVNADGSVTVNGTCTANCAYNVCTAADNTEGQKLRGRYIASTDVLLPNGGNFSLQKNDLSSYWNMGSSRKEMEVEFTDSEYWSGRVHIYSTAGTVWNNIRVYPMLRKADIEDSTYRPYNPQAIQNQLNAQAVLGAKNRLKFPYHHVSGTPIPVGGSVTNAGITYTVNEDGSITAGGTATGGSYCIFNRKQDWSDFDLYGKRVKLSVKPVSNSVYIQLYDTDAGKTLFRTDATTGEVEFIFPASLKNNTSWNISIDFQTGAEPNNTTYYSMLRLASDPDDTYVPYAMTNRELTEKVTLKSISNIDLDTIIENGEYYCLGNLTNKPSTAGNFGLLKVVRLTPTTNTYRQIYYEESAANAIYSRSHVSSTGNWTSWYKFTGTVV